MWMCGSVCGWVGALQWWPLPVVVAILEQPVVADIIRVGPADESSH